MSDPATVVSPEASATGGNRAAMLIVFLVMFIDLLGFGIMLPLLPRLGRTYLRELLPPPEQTAAASSAESNAEPIPLEEEKDSKLSGVVLGLLMASFSAMQFIFAPFWGRISDSRGRRPILILGLAGSVIFYALLGIACEMSVERALLAVILMFVARLGAGISGATIATAQAVIADSTTPEKRKVGMALIGAAFGIGFTFGPLIGFGALHFFPTHAGSLGFVAAALSFLALILAIRIMPETRQRKAATEATHVTRRKLFDWNAARAAISIPTVGLLITVFFLATFGFAQFETTLALLNRDNLKLGDDKNFLIFAYVGFVLMLVQGVVYRRLAKRLREETFMTMGIILMGLGVASLGAITWAADQQAAEIRTLILWTLVSLAVSVTGFAFLTPSVSSLVSRRSDPRKQGEVLGVNQSAASMARILGPAIGLPLYTLNTSHLLPYLVGACLILVMLPLMPRIRRGSDAVHATVA